MTVTYNGTSQIRNGTGAALTARPLTPGGTSSMTLVERSSPAVAGPSREYAAFLSQKAQHDGNDGFEPIELPSWLFPFQRSLVEWSLRKGRAALFADCGLGKTPMQLVWADNVHRRTGRPVLLVTPLAVSFQTEAEAQKFGLDGAVSRTGRPTAPLTITNYERLHSFDAADFGGVVCDESSAIKAFDGVLRAQVTEFLRQQRYRLLCTATAAPNDYIELGTSSEALGYLGYSDMLSRFFVNDTGSSVGGGNRTRFGGREKFRFRGHAETPFWKWCASWSRAMRRPSDLGFDDAGFVLPPLLLRQHVVTARRPAAGRLFDLPAANWQEEREELRRTVQERCEAAAAQVEPHAISLIWCHMNDEGDTLEGLIPNSLQVSGSDSVEYKEMAVEWFKGTRCICHEDVFRSKLSRWQSGVRGTKNSTTRNTESKKSLTLSRGSNPTKSSDENTCADGLSGTASMFSNIDDAMPHSETNAGENGTPTIPRSESKRRPKSKNGNALILTNALPNDSAPSASLSTSTESYLNGKVGAALSVEQPSAMAEGIGSTWITATKQDVSEAFSVQSAISDSESSATIQNAWSAPRCICGHISGQRRLISKPRIFGLGLNFQHCSHIVYFPSHSYEQYYQAVRRCWRFGQQHEVLVDVITTEGGERALSNLERKAEQASRMFDALVGHMHDALGIQRSADYDKKEQVPAWL